VYIVVLLRLGDNVIPVLNEYFALLNVALVLARCRDFGNTRAACYLYERCGNYADACELLLSSCTSQSQQQLLPLIDSHIVRVASAQEQARLLCKIARRLDSLAELDACLLERSEQLKEALVLLLFSESSQQHQFTFSAQLYFCATRLRLQRLQRTRRHTQIGRAGATQRLWSEILANMRNDVGKRLMCVAKTLFCEDEKKKKKTKRHTSHEFIAFSCSHVFRRREFYDTVLPAALAAAAPQKTPQFHALLEREYQHKQMQLACPFCLLLTPR
jgi:hypothetical protein